MKSATPLIRKLENGATLDEQDREALASLTRGARTFAPRQIMIREGDRPEGVFLLLEGFASREKESFEGVLQIMALLVPGDLCHLHTAILKTADHTVRTLSACTVVEIPNSVILRLTDSPRIARALWWSTLVDEAVAREWVANMGQRDAGQQMVHLFCELMARLQVAGIADETSFPLPLTQADLAAVLGLTPVHVNRTLQQLRQSGLLEFRNKRVEVADAARLREFCGFNPNYLHLAETT